MSLSLLAGSRRRFATRLVRATIVLCIVGSLAASAPAKDAPLTAIVLYDSLTAPPMPKSRV